MSCFYSVFHTKSSILYLKEIPIVKRNFIFKGISNDKMIICSNMIKFMKKCELICKVCNLKKWQEFNLAKQ